jgi:integrase
MPRSPYPPRLRARKRGKKVWFYYDAGRDAPGGARKEIPLGSDYAKALTRWAELEGQPDEPAAIITFRYVAEQYFERVVPTKAPRTQKDNQQELKYLLMFFDNPPCPFEEIAPEHVLKYVQWRTSGGAGTKNSGGAIAGRAATRAKREKALLSHIWNWARGEGYTRLANPCTGIRGESTPGRDIYVEDDVYEAIREKGNQTLQDAMDLALFCGQRPADTTRLSETQIRDGIIHIRQGKRKRKVRIEVGSALEELLTRIRERKAGLRVASLALIISASGKQLTRRTITSYFDQARALAAADPKNSSIAADIRAAQYRDIRAKAGTDKEEAENLQAAQALLGHSSSRMTEHYIRNRRGKKVKSTR